MRPRLFIHVLGMEARRVMSYRVDFWLQALLGFAVGVAIPYFLWSAIFAESGKQTIGGFDLRGIILYYVVIALLVKLIRGPDLQEGVAQDIYQGSLSRYLLYPSSYLSFKYAQHIGHMAPFLVQLTLLGGGALFVLGDPGASGITVAGVAMAVPAVALANLLFFLMAFPLQSVAFWADNVWSLAVLLRFATGLLGGAMLPLALFPEWVRDLLVWSPFPVLFHLPVSAVLGRIDVAEWAFGMAVGAGWCVVIFGIGRLVWRRGELQYTGVGI